MSYLISLQTLRKYSTCFVQYDHLELSKSKRFLYSNQPTKVDSNTCPDFVYIYHLCFRSNLASYQSFQSPREGRVIKSEKSTLQSNQLNSGIKNRKKAVALPASTYLNFSPLRMPLRREGRESTIHIS